MELAALGARVALVGRKTESLKPWRAMICGGGGAAALLRGLHPRGKSACMRWCARCSRFGQLDFLVNNAGGQFSSPLRKISPEGLGRRSVRTNLTGGFLMARESYAQWMKQHGGAIVNMIADMWNGMPGMGHSGAARAGMLNFTETAALEWAPVRVNAVAPGWIASSGLDQYPPPMAEHIRSLPAKVPAGRLGTESEISAAIVFFLSPAAAFISGSCIRIDGAVPNNKRVWDHPRKARRSRSTDFIWRRNRRCWSDFALARSFPRKRESRVEFSGGAADGSGSPLSRGRAEGSFAVPLIESRIDVQGEAFARNRAHMLALIAQLRALEKRAHDKSAQAKPLFDRRGQLLPRERLARLLDIGAPWLELCSIAGYGLDTPDLEKSVPGGGMIAGIGYLSGVRCMVVASDSGIDAGAIQHMGREKLLRAQELALANKLPSCTWSNPPARTCCNTASRASSTAARSSTIWRSFRPPACRSITVVHGSSTAGGAYMPGLSDYVIMVRGRAKAFLAGPPLLKAATGEIATDEELGGAVMHTHVSGLGEYLAEDDADGVRFAREVVARLELGRAPVPQGKPPRLRRRRAARHHLGSPQAGRHARGDRALRRRFRFPRLQARLWPGDRVRPRRVQGFAVGIVTNNGPLDPDGATKATHFIQACCQTGLPILYLQNTTGYIVGKALEEAGMIKHGSKMIQAVTNANVPQLTLMCGASFGAGNYGMCGRAYNPRFLFSWPNAQTAVMGAEQAALTMANVMEAGARRKGEAPDAAQIDALKRKIIENFESQSSAFVTSARMLDDGIIDPRDTRNVLGFTLSICREADARTLRPVQFGVARP
jgi:geranyl-CoA carboxylase beta subunit